MEFRNLKQLLSFIIFLIANVSYNIANQRCLAFRPKIFIWIYEFKQTLTFIIFHLANANYNTAIKRFVGMERHFDSALMSRAKTLAERERIDGSFEELCRVHAELVAATEDGS